MKKEKEAKHEAIVDMNEFLIKYGNQKLPEDRNIVHTIYDAASKGLENLDDIFQDNGFGRTENFLDVAKGFIVDYYGEDPTKTDRKANELAKEAINYLGRHLDDFVKWEK